MAEFEDSWQQKFESYEKDVQDTRDNQLSKIQEERERSIEEFKSQLGKGLKMSTRYIDLKFRVDQLSKAQRFEEAAELKAQLELEQ